LPGRLRRSTGCRTSGSHGLRAAGRRFPHLRPRLRLASHWTDAGTHFCRKG